VYRVAQRLHWRMRCEFFSAKGRASAAAQPGHLPSQHDIETGQDEIELGPPQFADTLDQ
jgi:hypothetical protein